MTHLSDDQLLKLAETAAGDEGFDDIQMDQLEHLKTCAECYETFCLFSTLTDLMGDVSGDFMKEEAEEASLRNPVQVLGKKILATMHLIKNSAADRIGAVMEQIDQAGARLQVGPSLAVATRGGRTGDGSAVRMEEYEDEKTYIVYKPRTNEVQIQINLRNVKEEVLHVYLIFGDSSRLEVPLAQKGKLLQGSISDIPEGNFMICIEAE